MLPSGERFACKAQQSVLNAAHAANILIPYSCRSGQCGSCRGKLIEGEVSYPQGPPDALSVAERDSGYALFCSAFAISDLTIELLPADFS